MKKLEEKLNKDLEEKMIRERNNAEALYVLEEFIKGVLNDEIYTVEELFNDNDENINE